MSSLPRCAALFGPAIAAFVWSCGGGSDTVAASTGAAGGAGPMTTSDSNASATSQAASTGSGGASGCPRQPAPADRTRKVVVSHPYDAAGNPSNGYEVLELSADGTLTQPGTTFSLGRSTIARMAFTPDGQVGIVPDDDGALGVVRFDAQNAPTVVHDKFVGSFYAGAVFVEAAGDSALVLDPNWRENGGGIYRVRIGCDGSLTDEGLIAPAKLPRALAWIASRQRAVVASVDLLDSPAGDDTHLVSIGSSIDRLGGGNAFGDGQAIVSTAVATHDETYALIADDNAFSGIPNRVAVVAIGADGLTPIQVLSPFNGPTGLATSPYDNAAIVVSTFDNAIVALGYDPTNAAAPLSIGGELAYTGSPPQVPSITIELERGSLVGRVLVAEAAAVRQLQFASDGSVQDLGVFLLGSGPGAVAGALGVDP